MNGLINELPGADGERNQAKKHRPSAKVLAAFLVTGLLADGVGLASGMKVKVIKMSGGEKIVMPATENNATNRQIIAKLIIKDDEITDSAINQSNLAQAMMAADRFKSDGYNLIIQEPHSIRTVRERLIQFIFSR